MSNARPERLIRRSPSGEIYLWAAEDRRKRLETTGDVRLFRHFLSRSRVTGVNRDLSERSESLSHSLARALQVSREERSSVRELKAGFEGSFGMKLARTGKEQAADPPTRRPASSGRGARAKTRKERDELGGAAAERRSKKRGLASIVCTVLTLFSHPWYSFQGQEKHFDRL